jgi:hypothetical protein
MQPDTQTQNPENSEELPVSVQIEGGLTVVAAHVKHSKKPDEDVFLRTIPVRHVDKFLGLVEDSPKLVEFIASKPDGWADTLTTASFEDLYEKALWLNRPTVAGYLARKVRTASWGTKLVEEKTAEIAAVQKRISSSSAQIAPSS